MRPEQTPAILTPGQERPLALHVVAAKKYFVPYRDALVRELQALGAAAHGVERLQDVAQADGVLVLGIHSFAHPRKIISENVILGGIHTEQLPTAEAGNMTFGKDRFRVFLRDRAAYDFLFDWSPVTAAMLSRRYSRIFHLDHGALPREIAAPGEPAYDLVFVGAPDGVDGRREQLLTRLGRRFRLFPQHCGLWGEKKRRAMASAAIVLNLHYDHGAAFEAPRVWEALSMGAFLLSEPMADSRPFIAGRDFSVAFSQQLPEMVAHYLEHPRERAAIAAQGRATAAAHPLAATAGRILRQFLIEKALLQDRSYARRRRLFRRLPWWEGLREPAFWPPGI
ncbi:glycosyltransferase family protein [Megalodesulfovibrio paquesii]